jgi:hypothetical protein
MPTVHDDEEMFVVRAASAGPRPGSAHERQNPRRDREQRATGRDLFFLTHPAR